MKLHQSPDDAKLLQEFIAIGASIPLDYGRFFVNYTFGQSMTHGCIHYMLDWKCENGSAQFYDLKQGIAELKRIKEKVDAYKAKDSDQDA